MSEADVSPDSMSRSELEAEVRDLRDDHQQLEARFEAMSTWVENIQQHIIGDRNPADDAIDERASVFSELDDLQTAVENHGETLATIADVESEKSSEGEKIGAIVAYADQARGGMAKALVTPKEIAGATGCSKRYAYDLVDKIGGADEDAGGFGEGQYPWAAVREATTVPTSTGTEQKPKALKIDFDRVQRNPDALNWFNNGTGGEGGE